MNLATSLRQARERSGHSIRSLADKSGVGKSTISRWEQGACLPAMPELRQVTVALQLSESEIQAMYSLILRPRVKPFVPQTDISGSLLRALRYRAGMSLDDLASAISVSKSTLSKWESGDRKPSPETLSAVAIQLGATEQELASLGSSDWQEESRPDVEERLRTLLSRLRTGAKVPLDLEFLSLDADVRSMAATDEAKLELTTRVRAGYVEWLGWWYRGRESGYWAERQLPNLRATRHLPVWGRIIRARNERFSEFGPKEPKARIQLLTSALKFLVDTPNEALVRRELATELINLNCLAEALTHLERARGCKVLSENPAIHAFCCDMVESHAWMSIGQVDRAARLIRECPPNDRYLKVSSSVGRAEILAAMGDREGAKQVLRQVQLQAEKDGYEHFARTARTALERIERPVAASS